MFSSTTEVSASRLVNDGEPVGATGGPTAFTSCLTSSATVPRSPMRGVTVRITPASRYSTVWFRLPMGVVVEGLVMVPSVVVLVSEVPVCWPVTTGTDCDTLMTAFLFSEVITCGFETMFTRFSAARVFSRARNSPAEKTKAVSPPPARGTSLPTDGVSENEGGVGSRSSGVE